MLTSDKQYSHNVKTYNVQQKYITISDAQRGCYVCIYLFLS